MDSIHRVCPGGNNATFLCTQCNNPAQRCMVHNCECDPLHRFCHGSSLIDITKLRMPLQQLACSGKMEKLQQTISEALANSIKSRHLGQWVRTLGSTPEQVQAITKVESKGVRLNGADLRALSNRPDQKQILAFNQCLQAHYQNVMRKLENLDQAVGQLVEIRIDNLIPCELTSTSELNEELEVMKELVKSLEEQLQMTKQQAGNRILPLSLQIERLNIVLKTKIQEFNELSRRFGMEKKQLQQNKDIIKQLQVRNNNLSRQLQSKVSVMRNEIQRLNFLLKNKFDQIVQLQRRVGESQRSQNVLKDLVINLKGRLQNVQYKNRSMQKNQPNYQNKSKQLQQMTNFAAELEQKLAQVVMELSAKAEECEQLKRKQPKRATY